MSALPVDQPMIGARRARILALAARGMSHQEIGKVVHLSRWTVKHDLVVARELLGVGSVPEAITRAIAVGFLEMLPDGTVVAPAAE